MLQTEKHPGFILVNKGVCLVAHRASNPSAKCVDQEPRRNVQYSSVGVLTEQKQVAGSSTHSFLSPGRFAYEEQKHKLLHALCSNLHWLTDKISVQYSVPFLRIWPIYLTEELAISLNCEQF